jgi:hypothetical protein
LQLFASDPVTVAVKATQIAVLTGVQGNCASRTRLTAVAEGSADDIGERHRGGRRIQRIAEPTLGLQPLLLGGSTRLVRQGEALFNERGTDVDLPE